MIIQNNKQTANVCGMLTDAVNADFGMRMLIKDASPKF